MDVSRFQRDRCLNPSCLYFQEREAAGVFEALWQKGLCEYDEFEGIGWEWQSIDGCLIKAPLAQESVGKNPTDPGKMGTKRSVLTDARGVPISIVLSGANTHDVKLLEQTLDAVVIDRPAGNAVPQHLCADAAYVGPNADRQIRDHGDAPQVCPRNKEREEKKFTRHQEGAQLLRAGDVGQCDHCLPNDLSA